MSQKDVPVKQLLAEQYRRLEIFAICLTSIGFLLLQVFAAFASDHKSLTFLFFEIALLLLLSVFYLLIRAPRHWHWLFYTSYYVVVFLLVYYLLPWLGGQPERSRDEDFLLHVALLLSQILRPDLRAGATVITLLSLHTLFAYWRLNFDLEAGAGLRLTFFTWLALIVLLCESVLRRFVEQYLNLYQKQKEEETDLQLARQVHKNLFPPLAGLEKIALHTYIQPQRTLGGDFFDLIRLREGNLGFFITDISGHGLSAAMMSAAIKVIISQMPYRNRLHPEQFLSHIDEIVTKEFESHHASAAYLFMDFLTRELRLANAGHPPILHASKGSDFTTVQTAGSLMGYGIRKPIADTVELPYRPGDRFFFYTDGLLEYQTLNQGVASMEDLQGLVNRHAQRPSEHLIDHVVAEIRALPDFSHFNDDVMAVLLEIL
ncbi:MAG: serine/threonine-protein phosphatase [Spirochaetales bacterium]|nr:serine/threonine-protein phosphatase [Spirochaetales bacterium]